MKLKVIQTGSAGNSYLLRSRSGETLIIEAGVNIKSIKNALDFDFENVAGCLITHEHLDHSRSAKEVLTAGIDVWALEVTHEAIGTVDNHRAKSFMFVNGSPIPQDIGSFKIVPFLMKHDVPCLGFLIHHSECGLTAFITDSFYCPYTFKGLNNIIVEANYSKEIIKKKFENSDYMFLHNRILKSHMSIETCVDFLKANDLTNVNNIVLIHLSDANSDEELFIDKVIEATGRTPQIAYNGLEIEFNKTPF